MLDEGLAELVGVFELFSLISDKAYEVYLYATNPNVVASKDVTGMVPNDSSGEVNVYWETVSVPG